MPWLRAAPLQRPSAGRPWAASTFSLTSMFALVAGESASMGSSSARTKRLVRVSPAEQRAAKQSRHSGAPREAGACATRHIRTQATPGESRSMRAARARTPAAGKQEHARSRVPDRRAAPDAHPGLRAGVVAVRHKAGPCCGRTPSARRRTAPVARRSSLRRGCVLRGRCARSRRRDAADCPAQQAPCMTGWLRPDSCVGVAAVPHVTHASSSRSPPGGADSRSVRQSQSHVVVGACRVLSAPRWLLRATLVWMGHMEPGAAASPGTLASA